MSNDPPPPYGAPYGAPAQSYAYPTTPHGAAQLDAQRGAAQYGPTSDPGLAQQPMYGQPTYAVGQPQYPLSMQQYPPGVHPYPAAPPPVVGVTVTAPPMLTATVVSTAVVTGPPIPCGPNPIQVVCPGCHATVLTSTEYQSGLLTWIIVGVLFFLGFWLCCFIPFCVNDCKDVIHHCPNCRKVVGKYTRM